jgi:hypothetical protein
MTGCSTEFMQQKELTIRYVDPKSVVIKEHVKGGTNGPFPILPR